jgi:uncharacterized protein (DUF58 family)
MSRAWFLALLLFVVVISGLSTLRGSELALAVPVVLYWLYAVWRAPDRLDLRISRQLSAERVPPGTLVDIQVSVFNAGEALDELTLDDQVPAGMEVVEGSSRHMLCLGGHQTFEFTYVVRGPRGAYPFGALHARASDALGLLPRTAVLLDRTRLIVLPTTTRVKTVTIRPRRTRVYAGNIPARVGGAGTEFFGVRPYELGDSSRRINWRAMARHPEAAYSNDFQQERVADVAVVLDGRERADLRAGGRSLFEYSVLAAGSLASALLRDGNRVGLLVYSQYLQWTMPGYGKLQRERILHALAVAAPGGSQIFEGLQHLPTRLFPAESQLVLISPVLEDDLSTLFQLRGRGYQVLVICPDPVSFEMSALSASRHAYSKANIQLAARIVNIERAVSMGRLRRAGVQVIEWDVRLPFDQAMLGAFPRLRRAGIHP